MKKGKDNKLYQSLFKYLVESPIDDDDHVEYEDDLKPLRQSKEQRKRDKNVSRLLSKFVDAYEEKVSSSKRIRKTVIIFSIICVSLFIAASIASLVCYLCGEGNDWQGLAAVVSAFLTCAGLLIGVLKIITKYAFPNDSEKNITDIVKAIQKNDWINRYYDLKASGSIKESDDKKILDEFKNET